MLHGVLSLEVFRNSFCHPIAFDPGGERRERVRKERERIKDEQMQRGKRRRGINRDRDKAQHLKFLNTGIVCKKM